MKIKFPQQLVTIAKRRGVSIEQLVEAWSERAAIREYLGGVPRDEAERLAVEDVRSYEVPR